MSRCISLATMLSACICLSSPRWAQAESSTSLRPVDIFVAVDTPDSSGRTVSITAKDSTDMKTVRAVVSAIPEVDESRVFLRVVPKGEPLYAPRTTGDKHIGINLSADPVELYVTDRMPYPVTVRLSEAISKSQDGKRIVVKSTHNLAKLFQQELEEKYGPESENAF